jgi:hypothetical protein
MIQSTHPQSTRSLSEEENERGTDTMSAGLVRCTRSVPIEQSQSEILLPQP